VSAGAAVRVEVVWALPERQVVVGLSLPAGSRVRDALHAARGEAGLAELGQGCAALGIFGRPVTAEQVLRDGDRVEIYRPLIADPRRLRRERAGGPDRVPRRR
jgi:uncharacterized protein